jgi:hypothetical protein
MQDTMVVDLLDNKQALKGLVQTAASVEKLRVAMGNRISALERGVDSASGPVPPIYGEIMVGLEHLEDLIDVAVEDAVSKLPVYNLWLRHIKGIGPALAAQMLAFLLPPKDGLGVGTWYKATGLTPQWQEKEGQWRLPRDRAGDQAHHHRYMRRCLHNVATSMVRVGGFYRQVYDDQKSRLVAAHQGDAAWPPHRLDDTARWITVKLLLSHLWHKWAEIEGVAIRPPYVIEVLGHTGYVPPPEPNGNGKI